MDRRQKSKVHSPARRFYDPRHLCAALHMVARTNPAAVVPILGHSTIALALQTHSQVLALVEEEAADWMGKRVKP